ncbi:MAG: TIGR01212 family radical SAM protein [Clostridia bacterium]|nr:TIGR01212 family radical SAM protein [Clostridia bacterium]
MKLNQVNSNPYKYSNTNKRYYTYDYYLKSTFGGKVLKIPLDCGFTCPNIDGKKGRGGCIYCSSRGSGDFAQLPSMTIKEQYDAVREQMIKKWNTEMTILYFQAHTNTYADADTLKRLYTEALSLPNVVGLNIATRADCLSDDVVGVLSQIAEKTVLTVELGLQSAHDSTGKLINRCHTFAEFCEGYRKLKKANNKIQICIHLIEGLPCEDHDMMLQTAMQVARLHPEQVKLHCLYVIKGTKLHKMYTDGNYTPIPLDEYVSIICDTLEVLPEDTVIGRLTGDADRNELIEPIWSLKKTEVINMIDREMYRRESWQGKYYSIE